MRWPSLSIIVTSLNRAAFIERTLRSILLQDYDGTLEVIVPHAVACPSTVPPVIL